MSSPGRLVSLTLAVAAASGLAGCSLGGDGRTVSQARDLAPFSRIDNQASTDVHVRVGGPQRVTVRAGEKAIDDVELDVSDGTLRVDFDHDFMFGDRVVVDVRIPRLDAVTNDGSGDIDVAGLDSTLLQAHALGSGDLSLAGAAAKLSVDLDGSGDAKLMDLQTRTAEIRATGSGDVEVRAAERLAVRLDGSGDVTYAGDPAVTRDLEGSGDLQRAG